MPHCFSAEIFIYLCIMKFVDTHTHLYAAEFHDVADVITHALDQGVECMMLPDIDSKTRPSMLALHQRYPQICPVMLGLHPTSVNQHYKDELALLEDACGKYNFIAIGETGMDLYWDKTFIKEQTEAFAIQLELAGKFNVPLVIHSRKSLNEIFSVLSAYKNSLTGGVFHCFPGSVEEARKVINYGFYLGIGGVVTYKNSGMAEVVKHFGLEHIVLETDAPYLPPVPHRGKRNQSAFIPLIAQFVADLLHIDIQTVAERTSANAMKIFKIQ